MKFFPFVIAGVCAATWSAGAHAAIDFARDTSDPLFLTARRDFLSETHLSYSEKILRLAETFSYGITDRWSVGVNAHAQIDFDGDQDGFSNVDLGAKYRLSRASDNSSRIISDVMFGLKFGGSSHVRSPEYADSIYYAGLRFGRQWDVVTLAATVKTNWIFDNARGMAYIDATPEAYFRLIDNWRLGLGFTLRKSTRPYYDREWVNFKIVRQYGYTQYAALVDYEFEHDEFRYGFKVNILF